ncbi:MAG: hypothetical protein CENE_02181 [Candidatus Celerinatantimonas neptuna]|nr:MAG: hypothetical protein CENE_02181 [Candidatus Celerinatantimonas neptuna]
MDISLQKKEGFTLIEILVVLLLTTIIAGFALQQTTRFVQIQQLTKIQEQLTEFIRWGRLQAIQNHQIIRICSLNDDNRCQSHWQSPLSIFIDTSHTNQLTSSDTLLRTQPIPANIILNMHRKSIRFNGEGQAYNSNMTLNLYLNHHCANITLNLAGSLTQSTIKESCSAL